MKASRDFVCVRLASFEDEAETRFLDQLAIDRPGDLKNSTFAILSPNTKLPLSAIGRSPQVSYPTDDDMAAAMVRIAARYPKPEEGVRRMPYLRDVRLGLNVASCDIAPFVVVHASDPERRAAIERTLAPLAWSDEFIGVFVYAATASRDELRAIEGLPEGEGVSIVQPDVFGLRGKLLAHASGLEVESLRAALRDGRAAFHAEGKNTRELIFEARRLDLTWRDDPGPEARKRKAPPAAPTRATKPAAPPARKEPADDR
ncbi:MAG: hypothetical protein JNL90_18990 [Planctomycetes bacterium]|nr:hypothetical protein [Planctomycetota bacterium]